MAATMDKICPGFSKKLAQTELNLGASGTTDPATNGKIRYVTGTGFRMYSEGTAYKIPVTTSTTTELNLLDGSIAGTAVASKALALGANKNVDTIAVADGGLKLGAGAGTAITATAAELNALDGITATVGELNTVVLTAKLTDISTASSTAYVVSPVAGTLSGIYTVINGAVTLADAVLTANVSGGTNVTATITVAYTGSAAGIVDSCTPADNNTVTVGDTLRLVSNGGSTDACEATVSFVVTL